MTNYAMINNVEHQDLKVITDNSEQFGDNVMNVMAFTFEMRSIQAHYPMLFHKDANDEMYPVAMFGFQQGENLFLTEQGWNCRYIPAMIQRQPFLIGFQESPKPGGEKMRVLSVDMDNPRVNEEQGEPLFQPLGGRTEFLEEKATLLETIYEGHMHNRAFVTALQNEELIESLTMEIQLNDGSRNQLIGFFGINEEKVQALSGKVLEGFSRQGFLMPMFMMLASTSNFQKLIDKKNEQLA